MSSMPSVATVYITYCIFNYQAHVLKGFKLSKGLLIEM